jgi:hypothetical protein
MSDAKTAEQLWLKAHEEVKKGNLAQAVRDLAKCYEMLKALKDPRLAQVHGRWVEVHKLYQARKAKAAQQAGGQQAAAQQAAAQQAAAQRAAEEARRQAEAEARRKAEEEARLRAQAEEEARRAAEEEARRQAEAAAAAAAAAAAPQAVVAEPRFSPEEASTLEQEAEAAANAGDLGKAVGLYERVVAGQPGNELAAERLAELRAAASRAEGYATAPPQVTGPADSSVEARVAFLEDLLGRIGERRRAV